MRDRFRFRIYYKPDNELIYDAESTYEGGVIFTGSRHHGTFDEVLEDEKNTVVMQSTGIKDIKGKLIYEGDILKVVNGSINCKVFPRKLTVKWCADGWNITKWEYDRTHYFEIIGNLYPNAKVVNYDVEEQEEIKK